MAGPVRALWTGKGWGRNPWPPSAAAWLARRACTIPSSVGRAPPGAPGAPPPIPRPAPSPDTEPCSHPQLSAPSVHRHVPIKGRVLQWLNVTRALKRANGVLASSRRCPCPHQKIANAKPNPTHTSVVSRSLTRGVRGRATTPRRSSEARCARTPHQHHTLTHRWFRNAFYVLGAAHAVHCACHVH